MKTLPIVKATPEQLPLISQNRLGVEVICGAAGSGKTSTALLRLRSLCYMAIVRYQRQNIQRPVKILILTFNRTLSGYVRTLAHNQLSDDLNVELDIDTFSSWARLNLPEMKIIGYENYFLKALAKNINGLTPEYVINEVTYLLGRFLPEDLESYITVERTGRGSLPRVDKFLRRRILDEVVYPYLEYLAQRNEKDWNGIAISMMRDIPSLEYDVVIVDESQDFSANQLRAIKYHLSIDHTITFVIDTVQRIYARGFTWAEVGFDVRPERIHKLKSNYRNTIEIARFAAGILNDMPIDGDGALPNLSSASQHGDIPCILRGLYSKQLEWAIEYIKNKVDLSKESVAFLKPLGGQWFDFTKQKLRENNLSFVELTREREWPNSDINIALSTFHSAKGLEFDYVFILGFNNENTPFSEEELDDKIYVLRRLLAVAVARARTHIVIGYKPGTESKLTAYFDPQTYMILDI
ncbi:3'-5' exonuclease [Acinetobacter baumannii]|uniref:3'-5' exonuclease n=1 Tax=Acinetobacter baumannii TaxID=470 RepID=UPI000DD0168F|nr:3'-5' exonuclease [Acinetobacter baumannii]MDO7494074.1 3'-5' exonuclease [Acinetobacter baumannii]